MTRIFMLVLLGLTTSVAHCADDGGAVHEIYHPAGTDAAPLPAADAPSDESPFYPLELISISTDSPLDLNWAGALELSDPTQRPTGVTLPFLEDYPINNLEVKFNLLNVRF